MKLPNLTNLTGLLTGGAGFQLLGGIIGKVIGGEKPQQAVLGVLSGKLDDEFADDAGRVLGRGICENIDEVLEAKLAGVSIDQKEQMAVALAQNVALELSQAADLALQYPALQAAVVRAKAGDGDLAEARAARNHAANRLKGALADVGRVAAGQAPQDL